MEASGRKRAHEAGASFMSDARAGYDHGSWDALSIRCQFCDLPLVVTTTGAHLRLTCDPCRITWEWAPRERPAPTASTGFDSNLLGAPGCRRCGKSLKGSIELREKTCLDCMVKTADASRIMDEE